MGLLDEARRLAGSPARQVADVEVRRSMLSRLSTGDMVQVFNVANGRMLPPTMLWALFDGPLYLLADYAEVRGAWTYFEREFNVDGYEIGGDRILVVPTISDANRTQRQEAQLARWSKALASAQAETLWDIERDWTRLLAEM